MRQSLGWARFFWRISLAVTLSSDLREVELVGHDKERAFVARPPGTSVGLWIGRDPLCVFRAEGGAEVVRLPLQELKRDGGVREGATHVVLCRSTRRPGVSMGAGACRGAALEAAWGRASWMRGSGCSPGFVHGAEHSGGVAASAG